MSEERLERIENQLGQVLQAITIVDNSMTRIENCMIRIGDCMTRIETSMIRIGNHTLHTTVSRGFNSLQGNVNDINADLARNDQKSEYSARQIRRLKRRLMYLEGRTEENF
jgi:archaellum component FlaC